MIERGIVLALPQPRQQQKALKSHPQSAFMEDSLLCCGPASPSSLGRSGPHPRSSWVLANSMTPSLRLMLPYWPAFHALHASSAWRHEMAPALRPSLWWKEPLQALRIALEWPRFSKKAGKRSAFKLPEMMGVVCFVTSHSWRSQGPLPSPSPGKVLAAAMFVGGIALHLDEAHGAGVDAGCADDAGDIRVHEGGVASLALRAGHGAVSRSVLVRELLGKVAAGARHCSASCHIAIHQPGSAL